MRGSDGIRNPDLLDRKHARRRVPSIVVIDRGIIGQSLSYPRADHVRVARVARIARNLSPIISPTRQLVRPLIQNQ